MTDTMLFVDIQLPLDKFDLRVRFETDKRVLGLFGPSGAGKTTIVETLAGLRKGVQGRIVCGGQVWLDSANKQMLPAEKRGLGYVPQDHLLFPHFSVKQNLLAGAGEKTETLFAEVVKTLELEHLLDRSTAELSGGERQRVALGRALCSQPKLLLLDEPLASLDIELRHRILPFLLRVREQFDIPMLIVSHNPMELLALCDELIAIREGRLLAQGLPTEVFTRADVYSAASLEGFENILPAKIEEHGEHTTRVSLGNGVNGQSLAVPLCELDTESPVSVGIPAHEILVATRRIVGLSARNHLHARVCAVDALDHKRVLRVCLLDTEAPELVVELTPDAVDELDISIDARIWLVIKSSSVCVYG